MWYILYKLYSKISLFNLFFRGRNNYAACSGSPSQWYRAQCFNPCSSHKEMEEENCEGIKELLRVFPECVWKWEFHGNNVLSQDACPEEIIYGLWCPTRKMHLSLEKFDFKVRVNRVSYKEMFPHNLFFFFFLLWSFPGIVRLRSLGNATLLRILCIL